MRYGTEGQRQAIANAATEALRGLFPVASIVCPDCGAPVGSWCVRHGRTQAGPLLACVARVRAARSAVVCPVSDIAGPVHSFVSGSGVVVPWSVMGDSRETVEVCAECGEHSEGGAR